MPGKKLRLALIAAATLVSSGWLADNAFGIYLESHLAADTRAAAHLEATPRIYTGVFPILGAWASHNVSLITSDVIDVDLPGLGIVVARTEIYNTQVTAAQLRDADFTGAPYKGASRTLRFDGVALGNQLGISDLNITHPDDISPQGKSLTHILLSGTPSGHEFTQVLAELRVREGVISVTPTAVTTGDEAALDAFSWTINSDQLPLLGEATSISSSGGSISIESDAGPGIFSPDLLSPQAAQS